MRTRVTAIIVALLSFCVGAPVGAQSISSSGALDGLFELASVAVFALTLLLAVSTTVYIVRHRRPISDDDPGLDRWPRTIFAAKIAGAWLLAFATCSIASVAALYVALEYNPHPAWLTTFLVPVVAAQLFFARLVVRRG